MVCRKDSKGSTAEDGKALREGNVGAQKSGSHEMLKRSARPGGYTQGKGVLGADGRRVPELSDVRVSHAALHYCPTGHVETA